MKEWLKLIFIILGFLGFMCAVGSVGALELDNITVEQFTRQCAVGIGIIFFSVAGYKAVSWGEDEMY